MPHSFRHHQVWASAWKWFYDKAIEERISNPQMWADWATQERAIRRNHVPVKPTSRHRAWKNQIYISFFDCNYDCKVCRHIALVADPYWQPYESIQAMLDSFITEPPYNGWMVEYKSYVLDPPIRAEKAQKDLESLWPIAKGKIKLPEGQTDASWGYNPNDDYIYLYSYKDGELMEMCTDLNPEEFVKSMRELIS